MKNSIDTSLYDATIIYLDKIVGLYVINFLDWDSLVISSGKGSIRYGGTYFDYVRFKMHGGWEEEDWNGQCNMYCIELLNGELIRFGFDKSNGLRLVKLLVHSADDADVLVEYHFSHKYGDMLFQNDVFDISNITGPLLYKVNPFTLHRIEYYIIREDDLVLHREGGAAVVCFDNDDKTICSKKYYWNGKRYLQKWFEEHGGDIHKNFHKEDVIMQMVLMEHMEY